MGLFSAILQKIRGSAEESRPAPALSATAPEPAAHQAVAQTAAELVDVHAVLTAMAEQKGGGGNWKTSIVDLLQLLGLDSSLAARKELAAELNVHAGADGTAEQNMALSRAVWQQLAQNGGRVPDSLKD